ncbi:GNAT family N-acetyltransferase [Xylanimonas oleitrophica]|uniref:GNAT family N-acetyltransferase n=1 Tax=Xylanimonas oleitrophica TaxID=2607479 RepID=A0A2W5Y3L3_9MICO|nr:GNAT family N-acetyltransferase [Xylanimonas oleitrophica]PZR52414.1 GNAT family N-acetyltransferase [Xylanimonas oleitrophica]
MTSAGPTLTQLADPSDVTTDVRQALTACWVEVTNAGGAAGFPFPPVEIADVMPFLDAIIKTLNPATSRLLVAEYDGQLAGWLNLRRDPGPLTSHWGTIHHLQARTTLQGRGLGTALMNEARRVARDEMDLEQLHLAARGGTGLEAFYTGLGWKEVGRWPNALRLAGGQDRDEVLMLLMPL